MAIYPDINLPLNLRRFMAPRALTAAQPDGTQLVSLDENGLAFTTGGNVDAVLNGAGIPKAAFQLATATLQAGIVPQTLTMAYASMHLTAGMMVNLNYNFASADANYNDFAFALLVDANDASRYQPLLLADQKHFQQQYGGLTGLDQLYAVLQGYHAGQHFTVDHTGDYRLLVGVADVADKTGVSELKLLDVSLGVPGSAYSVTTNFGGNRVGGLQLPDGSLLDLLGEQLNADGTAALGQKLGSSDPLGNALVGAAGQSIIFQDVKDKVAQNVVSQLTGVGGLLGTQAGGSINPQAGGLATLTPATAYPGLGVVPTNAAALIQSNGGNAALAGFAGVIGNDAGNVAINDGGSLLGKAGGGLIGQDGGGLIGQDGGNLTGQDGGSLISPDGGSLISQDGGGLYALGGTALLSLNGRGGAGGLASTGDVGLAVAFATTPATRAYTLSGDPGVAPATPPVAGPPVTASDAASGATVRTAPATAGLSDGRYVTVWTDNLYYESGGIIYNNGNHEIRGQVFDADGTKSGAILNISPLIGRPQTAPGVTGLAGGRFVVTWTGQDMGLGLGRLSATSIKAQFFNADATASGPVVLVSPALVQTTLGVSQGSQNQSNAASLSGGGAVITYRTDTALGYDAILGQRYTADGTAVGSASAIGPSYTASIRDPASAGLQDGGFVVAYWQTSSSVRTPGGTLSHPVGIYVQRFGADGASAGAPVQVNTVAAQTYTDLDSPAVAVLQDGSFVVSYRSEPASATGAATVLARRFTAAGAPVGAEVTVAANAAQRGPGATSQDQPVITALHDGGYAIAWPVPGSGADGAVIQAQVLSAGGTKRGASFTVSGAAPGDALQSPAIATLLDGKLYIAGSDNNGTGSSIRAESFSFPTTASAPATYGRVLDGPVAGATVFADANGNGLLDAGEATAATDAHGRYTFPAPAQGPVTATGGTDTRTGLALPMALSAPAGSLSITALSTLVQKVMAAGSVSVADALLRVNSALGLPLHTDATSGNPVTATLNGAVDAPAALLADAILLNTLTLAKAAGATGDLFGNLASQVAAANSATLDPTAASTLQALGLDSYSASVVSALAQALAQQLQSKLASDDVRTLVKDVTAISTLAQGGQAYDLAAAAGGPLGPLVTKYTGSNLANQIDAQRKAQAGTPYGIAYTDVDTAALGYTDGDAYSGPAAGLQHQYIWGSTDKAAIGAGAGNVFLRGGSGDDAISVAGGTNVLDGGTGSSFLVGGTGAGSDAFLVDGRGGGVTWSTIVNFHAGDAATIFGFNPGVSTQPFTALDGIGGYQGLTIHSELGGAGTGVNASMTFAGIDQATADAHFTITSGALGAGTANSTGYLYIQYNR